MLLLVHLHYSISANSEGQFLKVGLYDLLMHSQCSSGLQSREATGAPLQETKQYTAVNVVSSKTFKPPKKHQYQLSVRYI